MTLTFNKQYGFTLSDKFYHCVEAELAKNKFDHTQENNVVLNFRDPNYSAVLGGYHPVEVRLEKYNDCWRVDYVTDFAYSGGRFPELVAEIDINFARSEVYCLYGGVLNKRLSGELLDTFISNFVDYYSMEVFRVTVTI